MHANATTLAGFRLFADTPTALREQLARSIQVVKLPSETTLISQGANNTTVHLILEGQVTACSYALNGKVISYETLTAGTMFGELSVIDGKPPINDCVTATDVTLGKVEGRLFMQWVADHECIRRAVLRRMADMVRHQVNRFYEHSTLSVGERVRLELWKLVNDIPDGATTIDIDNAPTHAEIAGRINARREAVTRELKQLEKAGTITWNRHSHRIDDIETFKRGLPLTRN